jgi:hypothetical protein
MLRLSEIQELAHGSGVESWGFNLDGSTDAQLISMRQPSASSIHYRSNEPIRVRTALCIHYWNGCALNLSC